MTVKVYTSQGQLTNPYFNNDCHIMQIQISYYLDRSANVKAYIDGDLQCIVSGNAVYNIFRSDEVGHHKYSHS